jgi:hypothetical protein
VRIFWLILFALSSLGGVRYPAQAQTRTEFSDVKAYYTYGEQVVFQAKLQPVDQVKEVYLFIQPVGESTRVEKVDFNSQGEIVFPYDLRQHLLRPFARTDYWFRVLLNTGDPYTSEKFSFDYIDNRQAWQSLDDRVIQVNWIDGDLLFGQSALNAAQAAVRAMTRLLPGQSAVGVRIFIYGSATRLQETLNNGAASWMVGQASPDLRVILISVTPGIDQQLELERQIPHELMHVLLYGVVKENYNRVPIWLNEGIASLAETYPNPDYQRALKKAAKDNTLAPISALCSAFPRDASGAFLAYAESASFVQFLQNKFGNKLLLDLVNSYNNGYSCEDGVQAVAGASLGQLDYSWRQETLGINAGALAFQRLAPYLFLAVILLGGPSLLGFFMRRKP